MDETIKQLVGETRTPVRCAPGQIARYNAEYIRKGVADLFLLNEPLLGKR